MWAALDPREDTLDPVDVNLRAGDAADDRQRPVWDHLGQVATHPFAAGPVGRPHESGLGLPAGDRRIEQDHGDLLRHLVEHRLEEVGVRGGDDERADLLGHEVLDDVDLLVDLGVGLSGLGEDGGVGLLPTRGRAVGGVDPVLLVKGLGHKADSDPGVGRDRQLPATASKNTGCKYRDAGEQESNKDAAHGSRLRASWLAVRARWLAIRAWPLAI